MFWQSLILAAASLSLASPVQLSSDHNNNNIAKRADNATLKDPMYQLSTDPDFHYEILRAIALAPFHGSDVGEVLVASKQMKAGDFESYYDAFNALATRSHNISEGIDAKKFPVSAREARFKEATYYRSAGFYLHRNWSDPRILELQNKAVTAFNKAIALLRHPGEHIELQGDGFKIPAIFFSSGEKGPRPTIIIGTGYDGTLEELYHQLGLSALERGINIIVYEGPGQPTVRLGQNLGFIPQWEKVVSPIVDYALTRSDVNHKAIGLMGSSFGGHLAPRAAAYEHRLAAVMALDGIYDFAGLMAAQLGPQVEAWFKAGNKTAVDAAVKEAQNSPELPASVRWGIDQGLWSFNTESGYEWIKKTQDYTLKNITDKITMPIFVGDAETDEFFLGQGKLLAEHLGKNAHYHLFKAIDGAGEHCSVGAAVLSNQVVLDWFQEIVNKNGCN